MDMPTPSPEGNSSPSPESPEARVKVSIRGDQEKALQAIKKECPLVHKFLTMSDEEYKKTITEKSIDELVPQTEEMADVKTALEGMVRDIEREMDNMDMGDLDNFSFEKAFASLGKAMDTHMKPLMKKYKDNPRRMANGIINYALREQIISDQKSIHKHPSDRMRELPPIIERLHEAKEELPQSYDRILSDLLAEGKTIQEIEAEHVAILNDPDNQAGHGDAQGMLDAIQTLRKENTTLMEQAINALLKEKTGTEDLRIRLDSETLAVTIEASEEAVMAILKEQKIPFQREFDKDIDLKFKGGRYLLSHEKSGKYILRKKE